MSPLLLSLLVAGADPAAAKLFDEARAAMKANDLNTACPLFERSHTLEPALGTLLNLATCFEKQGKPAAAWMRFNEAAAWAARTRESKRETYATERATALKPRVSWLELVTTVAAEVVVDGKPVSVTPEVPVSVPVDAGPHVVSVAGAGRTPWEQRVVVAAAARQRVLVPAPTPTAPVLEPAPPPPPLVVVPPLDTRVTVVSAAPAPATSGARTAGWVAVAGGVGVTAASAVALSWSLLTYDALQRQRVGLTTPAVTVTRAEFDTLTWLYPASMAGLGVGIAGLVTGAVLLAVSPSVSVVPSLGPTGGSVAVTGTW